MLNPTLSRYCVLSCHHRGSSGRDAPYPALHDDAQGVVVAVPSPTETAVIRVAVSLPGRWAANPSLFAPA